MTALLSYEWRRMRSLGDDRALLAGVVAFALLADLAAAGKPLDAEGVVFHVVQRDLAVRWLAAAAIGAQAFGHEFRYGTIRPALLGFPRRGRLLAGKVAAAALAGTAGALLASAASFALLLALTRWGTVTCSATRGCGGRWPTGRSRSAWSQPWRPGWGP
jgi:ABC-type transport system involved in multi-copper enzyme maturation permease subunit